MGDLITPFKSAVGDGYKELEQRLLGAIHLRFGLPATLPSEITRLIKRADRAAAYLEATQLAGFSEDEAKRLFSRPRNMKLVALKPQSPGRAKKAFLNRIDTLSGS